MATASSSALRNRQAFAANERDATLVGRGVAERNPAQLFVRAVSRRGHELLVGAAVAILVGALWATGAWMTSNVARGLDAAARAGPSLSSRP